MKFRVINNGGTMIQIAAPIFCAKPTKAAKLSIAEYTNIQQANWPGFK
jgi:hypothetical protein